LAAQGLIGYTAINITPGKTPDEAINIIRLIDRQASCGNLKNEKVNRKYDAHDERK